MFSANCDTQIANVRYTHAENMVQKVMWYHVRSAEKQDQSTGIQHRKEIPSVKKQAESFYNSEKFFT